MMVRYHIFSASMQRDGYGGIPDSHEVERRVLSDQIVKKPYEPFIIMRHGLQYCTLSGSFHLHGRRQSVYNADIFIAYHPKELKYH